MEHDEAMDMMAAERYLLDELTPELRDAFEDHFFGCADCAQDVQLGAVFIEQTKVVLPEMTRTMSAAALDRAADQPFLRPVSKPVKQKRDWFAWLRPAVLAPAFACMSACLLAITGYQNLVVYPALQAAATEPRILPPATVLHDDTRSAIPVVYADLKLGTTVAVELPSGASYSSYKLECYNAKGKMIWTRTVPGDVSGDARGDDMLSFWLSGSVKQDTYKLVISGVTPAGQFVPIKHQIFDLQVKK